MSTPTRRRLMRDFKRLQSNPPGGVSGAPCSDNIMLWNAVIFGPADTPFEMVPSNLSCSLTKLIPTNHLLSNLYQKCSIPTFMRMVNCVSTFYKTDGVQPMMWQQFSPVFNLYCTTPTQTHLPMLKLPTCIVKTERNMSDVYVKLWKPHGSRKY
ncbi:unnamed protein product [Absidia cylindrospora]